MPPIKPRFLRALRRVSMLALPIALAAGLVPGAAPRADGRGLPPLAQAQAEPGGYSQAKLESYVAAVLKVQDLHSAWQPKITQAASDEEAKTLTAQATAEMIQGIKEQGLSVQEYNDISQAAEQDDQLYRHIKTMLDEARTK